MTAEIYARNKTVFWYLLYLAYQENNKNEPTPLFPGKDYSTRLNKYEEIEEKNDLILNEAIQKLLYYITLWFVTGVGSSDGFSLLVKEIEDEDKKAAEAPETPPATTETAPT